MSSEAGHIQISEFSKDVIPSINWMMEDLFCQYGVSIPYFMLDFNFPDYSERPDWLTYSPPEWYLPEWEAYWPTWMTQWPTEWSGYNFNLDWGPWGYWLTWFNEMLGILFDEAELPRWQMPDLSPASIEMLNTKISQLYDYSSIPTRIYIADAGNDRVVVLDLELNRLDSFSTDISYPLAITVDSSYIYVSGDTKMTKHYKRPSFGTVATKSISFYEITYDMAQDTNYLYISNEDEDNNPYVRILSKSDFSEVDNFQPDFSLYAYGIAVDSEYIYCSSSAAQLPYDIGLWKFDKTSPYSEVSSEYPTNTSPDYGLDVNSDFLYVSSDGGDDLAIRNKSDLSLDTRYSNVCTQSWDCAVNGDYVFMVDTVAHLIRKIEISTGDEIATFGEEGVSGSDNSHLDEPFGIIIG